MLCWSVFSHSPLVDEPAHLASGLSHWRRFSFDLYRVNPPLVRSIAAAPVLFIPHKSDWSSYSTNPYKRAEFQVGSDFIKCNTNNYHYLLMAARFFCIPFSLLGAFICYCWGRDLFGGFSGIVALLFWCFSPLILGFGYTILPDVPSASLGVTACYFYWKWLQNPDWSLSLPLGVLLGIVEVSKFTLLIFYPVWLLILIISNILNCSYFNLRLSPPAYFRTAGFDALKSLNSNTICINRSGGLRICIFAHLAKLLVIYAISIFVINMFYGFEGSFIQLKKYNFVSRALCGDTKWNHETGFSVTGNRFRNSIIGAIPVPLPVNFVMGIDVQKKDFEIGQVSYFCGQWSNKGWYQYYIFGLFIKEPLGFWLLSAISFLSMFLSKKFRSSLANEIILLAPIVVILLLVSSQTKLNHHLRYAIPLLPFLFISVSRVALFFCNSNRILYCVIVCLLGWSIFSSLSYYPHSQGHFNELIGRSNNAPKYLLGSNIDWGQNKLNLIDWYKKHPEARPLTDYYESSYTKENVNLNDDQFIEGSQQTYNNDNLQSGWFAIGVNELYSNSKQYKYFKRFKPVDIIGHSIYIYHITQEDANRIRQEIELPEIKENEK
jgi:hypothetical protein